MASIHKHYGAWRVQIRRQGFRPISKTFPLKKDALLYARETERALQLGELFPPLENQKNTLGDVLKRYVREVSSTKRGFEAERYRIAKLLRLSLSQKQLNQVHASDLAAYRDKRLTEVSSTSVRKELRLISHAITISMQEWGYKLAANPVARIRMPRDAESRDRRLVANEQDLLLQAARESRNPWLAPLIAFALETGMRRGEILGLTWDKIDIARRIAHLPISKNGRSREVPLSPNALLVLTALPRSLDQRVFPLTKESLRRTWSTACRKSGVENLRFHDLRHEATSRLFEKGLNVMEVGSITGHRDLRMLKRYTHLKATLLARKL